MGTEVKAKDELGQWPVILVSSTRGGCLLRQIRVSDGPHSLFQFIRVLDTIANPFSPLRTSTGSIAHTQYSYMESGH